MFKFFDTADGNVSIATSINYANDRYFVIIICF